VGSCGAGLPSMLTGTSLADEGGRKVDICTSLGPAAVATSSLAVLCASLCCCQFSLKGWPAT
jgi:hypothetical protein